jgi:putative ABC transport system permease protein
LDLPVLDETPIVTMRLSSVKGRSVDSLLSNENRHGRGWVFRREYRSTFTDHLRDGEKITAGQWVSQVDSDSTNAVPISVEQEIAKDLQVGLGDELVFDVQGVPVTTRVASLREVEWRRIEPNFFMVFPRGVLESAPAMHVLVTRVDSNQASARMQREVVKAFPNVSVIDLTLVLQTVDAILGKISFVIRFMAMFTVLTGLLVLVSALAAGRYQRIQESVLLRTLGASRGQILKILLVEYLTLGFLAALAGILLAVIATSILMRFVFHTPFALEWESGLIPLVLVPGITAVAGFLMSRGILSQSPLTILRTEV